VIALRERREQLGLSKSVVAQKAGLSIAMISFVERELRKPTLDTLLRMSEALDIDLWKVLRRATDQAG